MNKNARIDIRLDSKLATKVRKYAKSKHTTVTALIERHLRALITLEEQSRSVVPTLDAEQV